MNTGIWNTSGRHEANGLTLFSRYSSISCFCISCLDSRSFLPLYLFCSAFTLGWIRCMAAIDRNCLMVSGRIAIRTVHVSSTIATPQDTPRLSW